MTALDMGQIQAGLSRSSIWQPPMYLPETVSTNAVMRELPAGAGRHGTAVLTDFQTAGRGRLDRRWNAPAETSVLLSVALDWPHPLRPSYVTMMACLAVADAITDSVDLVPEIKWPNDVLINGRKACGILSEMISPGQVIIGCGMNVNFRVADFPSIPDTATTLQTELGHALSRERIILALLHRMEAWYGVTIAQPDRVFDAWKDRLDTIGREVDVHDTTGVWQGTVTGVSTDGGLQVWTAEGATRTVYAANVSVRTTSLQRRKTALQ